MSEEQLSALLARLKEDAGLQEKLKGAADLDAALAIAKEAGFELSKADWLKHQAKQTIELTDDELERVAGGGNNRPTHCEWEGCDGAGFAGAMTADRSISECAL